MMMGRCEAAGAGAASSGGVPRGSQAPGRPRIAGAAAGRADQRAARRRGGGSRGPAGAGAGLSAGPARPRSCGVAQKTFFSAQQPLSRVEAGFVRRRRRRHTFPASPSAGAPPAPGASLWCSRGASARLRFFASLPLLGAAPGPPPAAAARRPGPPPRAAPPPPPPRLPAPAPPAPRPRRAGRLALPPEGPPRGPAPEPAPAPRAGPRPGPPAPAATPARALACCSPPRPGRKLRDEGCEARRQRGAGDRRLEGVQKLGIYTLFSILFFVTLQQKGTRRRSRRSTSQ